MAKNAGKCIAMQKYPSIVGNVVSAALHLIHESDVQCLTVFEDH